MTRSNGLKTGRDARIYNFSRENLARNVQTTIDYYNSHDPTDFDPTKITWDDSARQNKNRGLEIEFDGSKVVEACYRPFCNTNLYYERILIQRRYQMSKIFPTGREDNLLICVSGLGGEKELSTIIKNKIIDLNALHSGTQCYPLYYYDRTAQGSLFVENLERRDGISDYILNEARKVVGTRDKGLGTSKNDKLVPSPQSLVPTKEDIFYYVYGFLHLRSYREKFSA